MINVIVFIIYTSIYRASRGKETWKFKKPKLTVKLIFINISLHINY